VSPPAVMSSHRGESQLLLVRPPEDWPVQEWSMLLCRRECPAGLPALTSETVTLGRWTTAANLVAKSSRAYWWEGGSHEAT
jgi:hypothetical protein